MGLIEDLKSLEELHARGRLSDEEFAAAKAAAISGSKAASGASAPATAASAPTPALEPSSPQKKAVRTGITVRRTLGILVIVALVWLWIQQNTGGKPASTFIKETVKLPVDLRDETFGIPASSWKAIGIQVPYEGSLTITVQVSRGNPMEMFLTDDRGLEQLKSTRQGSYIGGFYSVKGTSFQHTERIRQGLYYLVVWDRSLGILSASSSDVSVKAHIDP